MTAPGHCPRGAETLLDDVSQTRIAADVDAELPGTAQLDASREQPATTAAQPGGGHDDVGHFQHVAASRTFYCGMVNHSTRTSTSVSVPPSATATITTATPTTCSPAASGSASTSKASRDACATDVDDACRISGKDGGSQSVELAECRICMDEEVQDSLVRACACSGSLTWAHTSCLEKWIMERGGAVTCEICKQPYREDIMARVRESMALQGMPFFMDIAGQGRFMQGGQHRPGMAGDRNLPPHALVVFGPARDWDSEAAGVFARRQQHEQHGDVDELMESYERKMRITYWLKTLLVLVLTVLVLYLILFLSSKSDSSFWGMVLLRAIAFLLSVYLVARIMSTFRRRRIRGAQW